MRVNVAARPHQASPPPSPPVSRCRGLRRSESAVFGPKTNNALRLSPLRRSLSATCYFSDFSNRHNNHHFTPSKVDLLEPSLLGILPEPPNWLAREDLIRDSIARKANCVELPLSLRMIKKKKRNEQRLLEEEKQRAGDSISKAFNSTVDVFRELHIHALQLRGLAIEEYGGSITTKKIQTEMNSSLFWLLREVFAKTPDLMADVMVLMVDFAAHSMEKQTNNYHLKPQEASEWMSSEEKKLWDSMVEEASRIKLEGLKLMEEDTGMETAGMDDDLTHEFISPIHVDIQGDDYDEYYRTGLLYQTRVDQEPDNPLLLCNYAQFLYLVTHDYDRAEELFQRAAQLEPKDGEVLSQYATFLWVIRKDLWGAEERYQQAIYADPDNPYHASNYANFLWRSGAEDTCYPL